MLDPVVKPIVLVMKSDDDSSGLSVSSNEDILSLRLTDNTANVKYLTISCRLLQTPENCPGLRLTRSDTKIQDTTHPEIRTPTHSNSSLSHWDGSSLSILAGLLSFDLIPRRAVQILNIPVSIHSFLRSDHQSIANPFNTYS